MIVLGLTGSIGMGKSTASAMLRYLGIPVHDADEAVHDLLASGGGAERGVHALFPDVWDPEARRIDRSALGRRVFDDPSARARLESLLHPMVHQAQDAFLGHARRMGLRVAGLDIPLLFETGAEAFCDYTLCVTAPPFLQKMRVLSRAGMDEAGFERRRAAQMPDAEKRRRADFVVPSGLGRAETLRHLRAMLREITP